MSNARDEQKPSRSAQAQPGSLTSEGLKRREMLSTLGKGAVCAAVGVPVLMSVRSLVPNALYEQPLRFKAGKVEQFTEGPTFIADHRVFIFRESKTFYCISAVCTHLGCTVQLARDEHAKPGEQLEFHCPCHGSKFRADGGNFAGPAPRPLDYYRLELAPDDGQLIVDISQVADKGWRFSV